MYTRDCVYCVKFRIISLVSLDLYRKET